MPNGRHSLCNKSIVGNINFQKHLVLTLHVQHTHTEIEHGTVIVSKHMSALRAANGAVRGPVTHTPVPSVSLHTPAGIETPD